MATLDVSRIARDRIEHVLLARLYGVALVPKLVGVAVASLIAIALYGSVASPWVFVAPWPIVAGSVWATTLAKKAFLSDPRAFTMAQWRWIYISVALPVAVGLGLLSALVIGLPGGDERLVWIVAMCLASGQMPSRSLDGRVFLSSQIATLGPSAGVLLMEGTRSGLVLATILLAFVLLVNLFARAEHRRTRSQIARDLAGEDAARELEKANKELALAEETTRTVLENLSDGIVLWEKDGRRLYENKALARMHGIPPEVIGQHETFHDMLRYRALRGDFGPIENMRGGVDAWLDRLWKRTRAPQNETPRAVTVAGRTVEIVYRQLPGDRLLAVNRDVTELIDQQKRLAEARDEAAESHRRLITAMQALDDGIAFLDNEERLIQCNEAYGRFMQNMPEIVSPGVRLREAMLHAARAGAAPRHEAPQVWAERQLAHIRAGRPALISYGRQKWARVSLRYEADGRSVVIVSDVSEEHRREHELEQALATAEALRAEAEAATQAKSTFLATMSHEIRTPMNGVLGMMEVLEAEGVKESQARTLATIRESAQALMRIIDDLLDFSKIEAGALELEQTPFSLSGLVESVVATFRPQAERRGLTVVAAVAPGSTDALIGDPTRVRQILFNLLGNALKFTERGGALIRAHTEPLGEGRTRVTLSVSDTGIGMSEPQVKRLFQPFSQADSSTTRRYGGTGLGLSIVRRLAQLMGGDVTVESTSGAGSTFSLTLELLAAPADSPLATLPATGTAGDTALRGTALKGAVAPTPRVDGVAGNSVLVVDDHPINREVLVRQLLALGVTADSAGDGSEGLRAWRAGRYAIVFADVHMPNKDGFEMTAEIRRIEDAESRPRTPIVAVTANAMAGEDERCRAAGMDGYLAKPVSLVRLRATLQRWLQGGADDQPAIDPSVLEPWLGDDVAARRDLLSKFSLTATESRRQIESAMADGDLAVLAAAAHRLRGSALAVGAKALGSAAEVLERAAKAGDRASCQDGLGPLAVEVQRAQAEIAA